MNEVWKEIKSGMILSFQILFYAALVIGTLGGGAYIYYNLK
jgi:hypothetical protein